MATRQETARRRSQLAHELREGCRAGEWAAGELIPSINVLALGHQLSAPVVHEEIRKLVEAGVLYAVPGVGTFVSQSPAPAEPFLFLIHDPTPGGHESRTRRGFESQIADLGGAVIALRESEARGHFERGELPMVAGVFESTYGHVSRKLGQTGVPVARFGRLLNEKPGSDAVHFDDVEGGRRATQHLLKLGHTRVAFVGLHGDTVDETFFWSQEREQGWRETMREAGCATAQLSFHPDAPPTIKTEGQVRVASAVAAPLTHRTDITAVVAASNFAARGILSALREADVPAKNWPALVCFDEMEALEDHVISALLLPWEEVGRQGAELLWQRATGTQTGLPQQRLVEMKLIPRLTCRPDWAQTTRVLQRHAATTPPIGVAA